MTQRWIYFFGNGQADGDGDIKHLDRRQRGEPRRHDARRAQRPARIHHLHRVLRLFLSATISAGPTISKPSCAPISIGSKQLAGRTFGVGAQPLLVAVRSGAAQSMPGMMDTVLNVGLNPACVAAMAERTGNPKGATEAYLDFFSHVRPHRRRHR